MRPGLSTAEFLSRISAEDRAYIEKHHGPADCKLCGEHMDITERAYQQMGVCFACAKAVSNHWWHAHSGAWLTSDYGTNAPARPTKARISNALRFKVYERDGFKCVYCSARKDLTLDHVTPEVKGGATSFGNLVTACRPCNLKKKTASLQDFWGQRA